MKEQVINNVLNYLADKLPEEYNSDLRFYLYYQLSEYELVKKCTELAVIPEKTYMDYLNMYLLSLKISGRSDRTIDNYQIQLKMLLQDLNKPVEDITTDDLYYYLGRYKASRNVSNRYLDGKRVVFHGFFNWMVKKRYITYNPASALDKIKYEKKIKKPLTDEEREKIRCACKQERDLAIVEVLYSTGMRREELIRLNRDDIHFESGDCIVFGKGSKEREVYLNGSSCHHLKEYLKTRTDDNPALFVSTKAPHERLGEHGLWQLLKRLGLSAGVEKVHPHRYRHTTLTNALNRGMPVQEVQMLAGHTDINTTMIYCTVDAENVRASHKKYLSA